MKFLLIILVIAGVFGVSAYAQTEISDKVVVLHTQSGDMVVELFPADAPKTVANFINLTEHGVYDRTVFHRVIKDFMIQGGDPKTKPGGYKKLEEWGTGDVGYTIPGEFNNIKHKRGIVSMARGNDPDSASSQFFIVHKDAPQLDLNYAVFGRLATKQSYDTLDKIANLETGGEYTNYIPYDWGKGEILKAEVKNRSEIPDLLDQGEPERVEEKTDQLPQTYSSEKLGVSFDVPPGWLVQEPQKKNEQTPDLVLVGTKIGGFTPAISISQKEAGKKSLADYAAETKNQLQQVIDRKILEILNEETIKVNGNEAHVRNAIGKINMTSGQLNVKFKEVIIKGPTKFYILTYTNSERNFDSALSKFDLVLNSFKIKEPKSSSGGCLIATAAYGTELAPQVQKLREIRDGVVYQTSSGTAFMDSFNVVYYWFSPTISDWERQNPVFKQSVKVLLTPMLSSISLLDFADSEIKVFGYGMGVILLNIGMYFVAPIVIFMKIKSIPAFKKSLK